MPALSRARLDDIDRAKGLAIMLVVLGHIVARQPPAGNAWYEVLKLGLYQFHMAFFMYLSGITLFYSAAATTPPSDYRAYMQRRCVRFLVPFLLFGVAIILGKMLAMHVMAVDNAPGSVSDGVGALLWHTHSSPALSIWYLYVMFAYCAVVPPLMWLLRGRIEMMLALAMMLYWLPLPEYFYLDRIGHFFIFCILGGWVSRHLSLYQRFLDRWWWLCLILLMASLMMGAPVSSEPVPSLRLLVIGVLSLPALHGLVRAPGWNSLPLLALLGRYSLVIYLFNTIMIGAAKGAMLHIMSWDGTHFLVFAPLLLLAGMAGPIMLKLTLLRHSQLLDRMTT